MNPRDFQTRRPAELGNRRRRLDSLAAQPPDWVMAVGLGVFGALLVAFAFGERFNAEWAWPLFAAAMILSAATAAAAAVWMAFRLRLKRHLRQATHGRCPDCGYRVGLARPVRCPECGCDVGARVKELRRLLKRPYSGAGG